MPAVTSQIVHHSANTKQHLKQRHGEKIKSDFNLAIFFFDFFKIEIRSLKSKFVPWQILYLSMGALTCSSFKSITTPNYCGGTF